MDFNEKILSAGEVINLVLTIIAATGAFYVGRRIYKLVVVRTSSDEELKRSRGYGSYRGKDGKWQ